MLSERLLGFPVIATQPLKAYR